MRIYSNALIATVLMLTTTLVAQNVNAQVKQKPTIGIQDVTMTDAIKKTVAGKGAAKVQALERVVGSMGQLLIDRIHNTRKFQVVARSDLKTILKEQDLQSVVSDPSDVNVAQAFKIAGCKYALIVTLDNFQDLNEKLVDGGQVLAIKRTLKISATGKIYDTTTGVLKESANFQLMKKGGAPMREGVIADDRNFEELLVELAKEVCTKIAGRVVDVVYPARIIGLTGQMATINRGDGTGIAKGQIWTVYALGEAMIDPDTGENLGAEEIPVGKIKIIQITPKFSRAQVIENFGVAKLAVVRLDKPEK